MLYSGAVCTRAVYALLRKGERGNGEEGGRGKEGRKEGIYAIAPTYAARENREEEKERDVEEEKIGRRESIGRVTGITVWDWAYWRKTMSGIGNYCLCFLTWQNVP